MNKTYINLRGEEYEPMIPGTKCPVSVGVLEQWYWKDFLSVPDISVRIKNDFFVSYSEDAIRKILHKYNVGSRSNKAAMRMRSKVKPETFGFTDIKRMGASKDHLRSINKKAVNAWVEKCKQQQSVKKCVFCDREFTVSPCRLDQDCCSKHCSMKLRWQSHRKELMGRGLYCPYCFGTVTFGGKKSSYRAFVCLECKRSSVRPAIELGLRQQLEAAGALDDGRILASAFQKDTP